jgi:hypothetical protein
MDPCTIVTADEASALAGVQLGPGQAGTTEGNARLCTYGQAGVVFEVIAAEAPDVATAKAEEAAAEALIQKAVANGLTVTKLPGFADGADAALLEGHLSAGTQKVDAIAIYVLKGKDYFGFSDVATLGATAPSADAMEAQAMTTLGRIP